MSYGPSDVPLYYLVGRMSDQDDLHVLEFLRARDEIRLRRAGKVVIPHEITGRDPIDYVQAFQKAPKVQQDSIDHIDFANSVRFILDNRPIVVALSSWHTSAGAKSELAVALRLGLTVMFWSAGDFCRASPEFERFAGGVITGTGLCLEEMNRATEA